MTSFLKSHSNVYIPHFYLSVLSIKHLVLTFRTPQGIVAWSNGTNVNCQAERSSTVSEETANSSIDFTTDGPVTTVKSSTVKETAPTEGSSRAICQCPQEYSGEHCEVFACHNYCLNDGKCEIDLSCLPVCSCLHGTNGPRCEQHVCNSYCLNGGICKVDSRGQPSCECKGYSIGICCEILNTEKFCQLYCQRFDKMFVPVDGGDTSMCM